MARVEKRIKEEIFKNYQKIIVITWEMQHDGTFKRLKIGKYSAQEKLIELYQETPL